MEKVKSVLTMVLLAVALFATKLGLEYSEGKIIHELVGVGLIFVALCSLWLSVSLAEREN